MNSIEKNDLLNKKIEEFFKNKNHKSKSIISTMKGYLTTIVIISCTNNHYIDIDVAYKSIRVVKPKLEKSYNKIFESITELLNYVDDYLIKEGFDIYTSKEENQFFDSIISMYIK